MRRNAGRELLAGQSRLEPASSRRKFQRQVGKFAEVSWPFLLVFLSRDWKTPAISNGNGLP
jgi:hypothetical protein